MNTEFLIVGADGLLGGSLRAHWRRAGRTVTSTALAPDPGDEAEVVRLDLATAADTWPELPRCRAAVLTAAVTGLELCRCDPSGTRRINVEGTLDLARRLSARGTFVVFISTNLVFDGMKPHREADEPLCPRTEYGRQKAAVETGLTSEDIPHAVVRLTKVFHRELPLMREWAASLRAGQAITPFEDMLCAPVALGTVIRGIAAVSEGTLSGRWQFSPGSDVTYADIAGWIVGRLGADSALLRPVTASAAPGLEHLPRHTTLDAGRAERELGLDFAEADQVLASCWTTELDPI